MPRAILRIYLARGRRLRRMRYDGTDQRFRRTPGCYPFNAVEPPPLTSTFDTQSS
jgi:hypothetical protein